MWRMTRSGYPSQQCKCKSGSSAGNQKTKMPIQSFLACSQTWYIRRLRLLDLKTRNWTQFANKETENRVNTSWIFLRIEKQWIFNPGADGVCFSDSAVVGNIFVFLRIGQSITKPIPEAIKYLQTVKIWKIANHKETQPKRWCIPPFLAVTCPPGQETTTIWESQWACFFSNKLTLFSIFCSCFKANYPVWVW